jgi:hypothetical protein
MKSRRFRLVSSKHGYYTVYKCRGVPNPIGCLLPNGESYYYLFTTTPIGSGGGGGGDGSKNNVVVAPRARFSFQSTTVGLKSKRFEP